MDNLLNPETEKKKRSPRSYTLQEKLTILEDIETDPLGPEAAMARHKISNHQYSTWKAFQVAGLLRGTHDSRSEAMKKRYSKAKPETTPVPKPAVAQTQASVSAELDEVYRLLGKAVHELNSRK